MPVSSPASRFLLGAVLTVAVVLIVVVACSRPSSTEPDHRLRGVSSDDGASAGKSPIRPARMPREPITPAAQQDSPGDVLRLDPEPDSGSDPQPDSQPDPERTEQPEEGASQRQPNSDRESVPHKAPPVPAAPLTPQPPPVAPVVGQQLEEQPVAASPTASSPPTQNDSASMRSAAPSGQSVAETLPPQTDQKQPPRVVVTEQGEPETQSETQPEPLQRLSREFARRRAAQEQGPHVTATEMVLPAPEVYQPTVVMSQTHRQSCLVAVGDEMPDGLLMDAEGKEHSIRQSLGESLTVVVLWNAANPYALDQFEELANDVGPYAQQGVQVIAIHVGPAPANYQELCQQYGQESLCLLDPQQRYFAKVAQKKLPRTYVLDAAGKIVWLDIEYSRTTRYELHNALQFYLPREE